VTSVAAKKPVPGDPDPEERCYCGSLLGFPPKSHCVRKDEHDRALDLRIARLEEKAANPLVAVPPVNTSVAPDGFGDEPDPLEFSPEATKILNNIEKLLTLQLAAMLEMHVCAHGTRGWCPHCAYLIREGRNVD
jgi:hypothetical protein